MQGIFTLLNFILPEVTNLVRATQGKTGKVQEEQKTVKGGRTNLLVFVYIAALVIQATPIGDDPGGWIHLTPQDWVDLYRVLGFAMGGTVTLRTVK